MLRKVLLFLPLLLGATVFAWAKPLYWAKSMPLARADAASFRGNILIDFQAIWCYSCYYMEKHVLETWDFKRFVKRKLALLMVDVDEPEGRELKERYNVRFLPTYVVIDRKGNELGRIVGERRKDEFLSALKQIVANPSPSPTERIQELVNAANWIDGKKEREFFLKAHKDLPAKPSWRVWSARLDQLIARETDDPELGTRAIPSLLRDVPDCQVGYDAGRSLPLIELLPPEKRKSVLQLQYERLRQVVDQKVLVDESKRCADYRTPVEILAKTADRLQLEGFSKRLYERMTERLERDVSKQGLGENRNLDDNLRFFLELQRNHRRLDELYPKLVKIYPYDYVYPYRYAKNLYSRGFPKKAHPWSVKASALSYGVNRLYVTHLQARILRDLKRFDEAYQLLRRDIVANRRIFPEEVKRLEELMPEIMGKVLERRENRPEVESVRDRPAHPARFRGE